MIEMGGQIDRQLVICVYTTTQLLESEPEPQDRSHLGEPQNGSRSDEPEDRSRSDEPKDGSHSDGSHSPQRTQENELETESFCPEENVSL